MDVLTQILAARRRDAARARRRAPLRRLLREAGQRNFHSLADRLRAGAPPRIIAEIKRASPSAGPLRLGLAPAALACEYEQAGAVGLSVLTEPRRFLGSEEDLREVRRAVGIPLLRKDFISDPYQVAEAAAWGADVVLLIAAGLEPALCRALYRAAREIGLETIVEIHQAEELETALDCREAIIGVNSRNLKTLRTDRGVPESLAGLIPADRLCIAESGIRTAADVKTLTALGYRGLLIGEALLRSRSPARTLRALRGQ
jgi:indole-3-glycerol phosphate synthase